MKARGEVATLLIAEFLLMLICVPSCIESYKHLPPRSGPGISLSHILFMVGVGLMTALFFWITIALVRAWDRMRKEERGDKSDRDQSQR